MSDTPDIPVMPYGHLRRTRPVKPKNPGTANLGHSDHNSDEGRPRWASLVPKHRRPGRPTLRVVK